MHYFKLIFLFRLGVVIIVMNKKIMLKCVIWSILNINTRHFFHRVNLNFKRINFLFIIDVKAKKNCLDHANVLKKTNFDKSHHQCYCFCRKFELTLFKLFRWSNAEFSKRKTRVRIKSNARRCCDWNFYRQLRLFGVSKFDNEKITHFLNR
jgi:hypothetical protein